MNDHDEAHRRLAEAGEKMFRMQASLMMTLVDKDVISREEAARLIEIATSPLHDGHGFPDRGFAKLIEYFRG